MPSDQINDAQRVFIYARVSSDLQSAASLEDLLRVCEEASGASRRNMSSINAEIIRCVRDVMERHVNPQVPCPPPERPGAAS